MGEQSVNNGLNQLRLLEPYHPRLPGFMLLYGKQETISELCIVTLIQNYVSCYEFNFSALIELFQFATLNGQKFQCAPRAIRASRCSR